MGPALFGYGSLINTASRRLETGNGVGVAVRVSGLSRGWFGNVAGGAASMGAVEDPGGGCNGILFPADCATLDATDRRELPYGYRRARLAPGRVEFLAARRAVEEPVWVYLVETPEPPTEPCPILQSYVDVVLGGCFEVGAAFAEELVRTTSGWDARWIDDRAAPRYPRAQRDPCNERRVDELLARLVPEAWAARSSPG